MSDSLEMTGTGKANSAHELRINEYLSHIETYTTNKTIGQVQHRTSDQYSRYCTGELGNVHY
jgi:hypothetical protein